MTVKLELRSKSRGYSTRFTCRSKPLQRNLRIHCRGDRVLKLHTFCADKPYINFGGERSG
jgi:hypothetical protein